MVPVNTTTFPIAQPSRLNIVGVEFSQPAGYDADIED